ncbi:DUF6228 family protein [Amycolatopsis sp. OK19-0408]|uniref:DUF6228 family protein n=1 Tax=Amycolatopsis iheyensis TaxID=2945988 RepID=A0A9X2NHB1_9PSEU|nr:DUF6228 family protein [Amycolatopsis iheyensis]MCR6487263.1 DUF6228 family protein [Amycolatopsis iheyensis]
MTFSVAGQGVTLTLTGFDASEGDLVYFTARAEGADMAASVSVQTLHGDGLAAFAAGLDEDFRGWPGVRVWTSSRGELELRATHDGRVVGLEWTLRYPGPDWEPVDFWTCTVRTHLTPGEDLRRFSADLAQFLSH